MFSGINFKPLATMLASLLAGTIVAVAAPAPAKQPSPAPAKSSPAPAKSKAEMERLLASGDSSLTNSKPAEAVLWYRQAAMAGSVDAIHRAACLLLDGKKSTLPKQTVARDMPEGVRMMFWAATNMHSGACQGMGRIFQDGLGVKTNLVQAYAWLRLSRELEPASAVDLDSLAIRLPPQELLEAQSLARQFKSHYWPPAPCKRVIDGDPRLTLSGLTMGIRGALAVINHKTLAEGESADVGIGNRQITVTCLEIREQSVLVDIVGESDARLLTFR